ncbi:diphthine synthase [Panicum miliaceum]|uniref:Diphthine synthase n=1 Tax=Panicum miliaceum TaxID=4540 RepID=A0A3L6SSX2_PANMI|nr:diphthine synthase [Panicum miliaceum]
MAGLEFKDLGAGVRVRGFWSDRMAGDKAVRICSKIYMEAYTSLLSLGLDPWALAYLEKLYEK